jgi:hypothetical protein
MSTAMSVATVVVIPNLYPAERVAPGIVLTLETARAPDDCVLASKTNRLEPPAVASNWYAPADFTLILFPVTVSVT